MGKFFKIEVLAVVMISIMLGVSYLIKIKNEKMKNNFSNKELEVHDSVTIEVNATDVESKLYAKYMVKTGPELKMTEMLYKGKRAKFLKSKYSRSVGNMFYLDENISMLQDNGYYYKAQHAIYDKNNEMFYVTSPYTAYLSGGNIIRGTSLKYNMKEKLVTSENVDAIFFTANE